MRCTRCEHDNRKKARFCAQCGAAVVDKPDTIAGWTADEVVDVVGGAFGIWWKGTLAMTALTIFLLVMRGCDGTLYV